MNKKHSLFTKAFVSAFGVFAYVALFAWFMNNAKDWFGGEPAGWLVPVFMLLLFIVSACVTGSLVLLRPVLLYVEGQKKEAIQLFGYTVAFLVLIALIVGVVLVAAM